jgi:transposase
MEGEEFVNKKTKQERYEIITYGIKFGVTKACTYYGISRTIYYRWLKRFETYGVNGLEEVTRKYTPKNKASNELENLVLNKIRMYPKYGPQSIAWMVEDSGFSISASGVFNIMKRNHVTSKKDRMEFCKQQGETVHDEVYLPLPKDTKVGEIWLCWTDCLGNIDGVGDIYQYCILDVRSGIACSRIFRTNSTESAVDTLLGVAIPMGKDLNMNPRIIITRNVHEYTTGRNKTGERYTTIVKKLGIQHVVWSEKEKDIEYTDIAERFSRKSLKYLQHKIFMEKVSFSELKVEFQKFVREYNLKKPFDHGSDKGKTPFDIVVSESTEEILLPLWAHIDRIY